MVGRDDGEAAEPNTPNGIKMPIPPDAAGYTGRRSIVAMDETWSDDLIRGNYELLRKRGRVVRFDTVCPDGLARTGSERTIDILRDRLLIRATLQLPQHVDGALYDPTTDRGLTVKNQLKPLHEAARPAGASQHGNYA